MRRKPEIKNPGSRDRDRENYQKNWREVRSLSDFSSQDAQDSRQESEETQDDEYLDERLSNVERYSTERFDASTQGDQTTRTTSVAYERAILVGVYLPGQGLGENPLDELAGLAEAADVLPVGSLIQRRAFRDIAYCLGKGKLDELQELVESRDAQVVLFDLDLAPGQTRNLEKFLHTKVIDRTELILDVFASRARTREAKLAVELAQLEYSLPRLKRMWTHLERQTVGGVGLRGPGEKQLEVDRRIAQRRISDLKREIDEIHARKKREIESRELVRRVCLVGYTNAGKSSLLNATTSSDAFVQDMLFATLDARTRRWFLPGWGPVLLSDTVGFVRDLPHHLVASFRATLEETTSANLLIHVADASAPDVVAQIDAVHEVLERLDVREKDSILVLNKIDAIDSEGTLRPLLERYPTAIPISAKTRAGFDKLTAAVSAALSREFVETFVDLPIADGKTAASLARDGEVLSREYATEGLATIHCRLPRFVLERLRAVPNVVVRLESRDAEPFFTTGNDATN